MSIQPKDGLLAIYRLVDSQKPKSATEHSDEDSIPLEDLLVVNHRAVLLEVTDIRPSGYAAKSIPLAEGESSIRYVSVGNTVIPYSDEPMLDGLDAVPTVIHLGAPVASDTPPRESLYAPGANVRYHGIDATVSRAYENGACTFDELPGVWLSEELWRYIDTHLGLEAFVDGVRTLDLCVPMPKVASAVIGNLEAMEGWRELLSLYQDMQDFTPSALLQDFKIVHESVDLERDGKIEAQIVGDNLAQLATALTSLSDKIPGIVSVLIDGVKTIEAEYGALDD